MVRRFLIAVSLTNLMFLRIWRELLNGKLAYYAKVTPNGLMGGLMLNILLLGLLFWMAAEFARRRGNAFLRAAVRWIFFVLVLLTASFNKLAIILESKLGAAGLVLFALLALALLAVFTRWRDRIAHGVAVLLLIASPFVLVTFAQGAWVLYQVSVRMNFADLPAATALPPHPGARVVWMIFDEMDQRQTFAQRDPSVQMPEFDRLRSESLYAENAYPPARATELSLPALLSGKLVSKATPLGSDELIVYFGDPQSGEDKTPHRWSREPTIFSDVRAQGINLGLTGWFHPYCRIAGIAASLTECHWQDGGILLGEIRRDASISVSMLDELMDIPTVTWELRHVPGFISAGERERADELRHYQDLAPIAIQNAADPTLGLVVLHIPVPHPHGIYDRKTGQFSTDESHGYLDNLALADRTLGEVRAAMEKSGVWKDSIVIASADHWWRSDFWSTHFGWAPDDDRALARVDHRIPFLVRFPEAKPRNYAPQFNTVLTHDLVLAIFRGEVADATGAAAWLDVHKTIGDSPYSVYRK